MRAFSVIFGVTVLVVSVHVGWSVLTQADPLPGSVGFLCGLAFVEGIRYFVEGVRDDG